MSIKKGGFGCQWLGNVDMHMYVKCDKIYHVFQRVMNIFTTGRTGSHSDYNADPRVVQSMAIYHHRGLHSKHTPEGRIH